MTEVSKCHFFLGSPIFTQSPTTQAFGPVNSNEFRLTNLFSLESETMAYAICKGIILIQPQIGSTDKVNLILRPYKQPIPGLNIKYFIYRGLKKSDFFNGTNILQNDSNTSDFINKINADFDAFYDNNPHNENGEPISQPAFSSSFIGYNENTSEVPLNTLISDFFFKQSEFVAAGSTFDESDDFELPMIGEGKSLGKFATGECGIDIVLHYGDYKNEFDNSEFVFDLNYARINSASILIDNQQSLFKNKLDKEQILNFIDITTFYGLFKDNGELRYHNTNGDIEIIESNVDYSSLLNNFSNKNKVYLHLISNRNRTYNFYNNYSLEQPANNNIKININNNLTEDVFEESGWPLKIFEFSQINDNDINEFEIHLLYSKNSDDIFLFDYIKDSEKSFLIKEDIIIDNSTELINFSKPIKLAVKNIDDSGQKKCISTLIKLQFIGDILEGFFAEEQIWEGNRNIQMYNYLFSNVDMKNVFSNNNSNELSITVNNKIKIISHRNISYKLKESGVFTYKVNDVGMKAVYDSNNIFETYINKNRTLLVSKKNITLDNTNINDALVLSKTFSTSKYHLSTDEIERKNSYLNYVYGSVNFLLENNIINENGNAIRLLNLTLNKKNNLTYYNLGLTNDEIEYLFSFLPTNSYNISIYFSDDSQNPRIDYINNISFVKYSLGLTFENNDGLLTTVLPTLPILVYGFSHHFLVSKEYSDYEFITSESSKSIYNEQ